MLYTGTARQNRMAGCELEAEQESKRDGRGSYDTKTEITHNISAVRWYDNRAVTLIPTASGVDPIGKARRWDKKAKEHKEVTVPAEHSEQGPHKGSALPSIISSNPGNKPDQGKDP